MKRGEIYTSNFLKAQDLLDEGNHDGLTLTIKKIETKTMDDGNAQRVLSFQEDERALGLNVTNWNSIAEITGQDDDDNWIGSKIHVYPHQLDRPYMGKTHGIRVKAPVGQPQRKVANTNANRNAIPNAANAQAITAMKVKAYNIFKDKTPGMVKAVRDELFRETIIAYSGLPNEKLNTLGENDWIRLGEVIAEQGPANQQASSEMDESGIPF